MVRTRVAAVCLAAFVLSAGCLATAPSGASPSPSPSPSPSASTQSPGPASRPPFPEKPANLSASSVVDYAAAYERATVYRDVHSPGADVTLRCNATLDRAVDDGYYVVAACGGSVTHPDGAHGDVAPTGHPYFVNRSETIRVDAETLREITQADVYRVDDASENLRSAAGLSPRGFEVLNFDGTAHTVTVEIDYLNATEPSRVLSESYTVSGHDGGFRPGVTARKGTYVVTARLDTGATDTFQWTLSAERADRLSLVVTPDGTVEIRPSVAPTLT